MNADLTVIILTRDEAADLPACLAHLTDWPAEVVVVDSHSVDGTQALARAAGARVLEHPFAGFGAQRNWALDEAGLRTPWVLFLDADEHATAAFRAAVDAAMAGAPSEVAGFYLCWRTLLQGRWLKRCDSFPKWQFRLLRRGRARFIDAGHGQKEGEIDGRLEYVTEPYDHHAFRKGWTHWFEKHNRYASQEALARLASEVPASDVLSRDPSRRNRALKPLVSRLPGWPILRFLYMYVARGGFLEGRPGFEYCVNMGIYEYLIRLKMRELRSTAKP